MLFLFRVVVLYCVSLPSVNNYVYCDWSCRMNCDHTPNVMAAAATSGIMYALARSLLSGSGTKAAPPTAAAILDAANATNQSPSPHSANHGALPSTPASQPVMGGCEMVV